VSNEPVFDLALVSTIPASVVIEMPVGNDSWREVKLDVRFKTPSMDNVTDKTQPEKLSQKVSDRVRDVLDWVQPIRLGDTVHQGAAAIDLVARHPLLGMAVVDAYWVATDQIAEKNFERLRKRSTASKAEKESAEPQPLPKPAAE
jgi:hypothetical protein